MSEIFGSTAPRLAQRPPHPRTKAAERSTAAAVHTSTLIASTHDAHLIGILDAPLAAGEPAYAGFRRKEAAFGDAVAALSVAEQRAILTRLSNPRPGDHLAAKFMRFTIERRTRLLGFLADARRREALAR